MIDEQTSAPEPVFDWQVFPPDLKTEDPAAFQKVRLAATLDLLKFEVADLPFQARHDQRMKMRNVVNFVDNTKRFLSHGMDAPIKTLFDHWTDNLGAQAWNVLDSFFKSQDQRVFLHMVNLYNAGAFTLPGLDKPLNQCSFDEVIVAEQEEERLYWKHQQRIGTFIPLSAEDLKTGVDPTEKLTLADFKLAAKAIDKAVLIVYEDLNGNRQVLRDQTGDTGRVSDESQAESQPESQLNTQIDE